MRRIGVSIDAPGLERYKTGMRHELVIEGMGCDHCVRSVERALGQVEGVLKVEVELGQAVVETREGLDLLEALRQAVAAEGYDVARAA